MVHLSKGRAALNALIAYLMGVFFCAVQFATLGVAVMDTFDAPPHVDAEALRSRLFFIREHTRQTYCHPRSEVEGKPVEQSKPEPVTDAAPVSRWEDS